MNVKMEWVLEFRRNKFGITQHLIKLLRFFIPISPILLIFRTSTGQRLRKEQSVQDACMGSILEGIEGLNTVETDSGLGKDSWRYSGFSLQFCRFSGFQLTNTSERSGRKGRCTKW